MPQTLLAVGALAVMAVLTLQSQGDRAYTVRDVVDAEITTMSARVASDVLNGYRTRPFDAATASGAADSPGDLWPHARLATAAGDRFGTLSQRAAAAASGATLDAVDGRATVVQRQTASGSVSFRVESVVGYVAESDGATPQASASKFKMATVRVTPQGVDASAVVLSQLYACGSGCDW